jgi:hypothetical protein
LLECARNVVQGGRDGRVGAGNVSTTKLPVKPLQHSGFATAARTKERQMLPAQKPALQWFGEHSKTTLHISASFFDRVAKQASLAAAAAL